MKTVSKVTVIAAIVLAVILIGEVYVYSFDAGRTYGSDVSVSDNHFEYSVHSGISNTYDIVISDNGDFRTASEYYLYYDPAYADCLADVPQPVGSKKLDQDYYVSQLVYQLKNRGISVTKIGADALGNALTSDISNGECGKGLIAVSGALPDTVYTGNVTDPILRWIDLGGSLYWAGNLLGAYYSTLNGIENVQSDYQNMFFGVSDCLTTSVDKAYSDNTSNGYRYGLALSNNSVKYSVRYDAVPDSLSIGYIQDGYASEILLKHGDGMICIVGGDYSNDQRSDLAQIIGAHLCYKSVMEDHMSGTVTRSTVSGIADAEVSSGYSSVYIFIGGYYLEYARCYSFLHSEPI